MSNPANRQMQNYQPQRMSFSQIINQPKWTKAIAQTIQDPAKRRQFMTAIIAAVSNNLTLQECTPASIITGALQGAALNLSPSPQMGQYYLVPFNSKEKDEQGRDIWVKKAQFIPGYKGYIQLALRSGECIDIDARPVVDGEYLGMDSLTGRPRFQWLEDDAERERRPVVGYMAFLELKSGFRKVIYWSKEKMISHADKYSQAFSRDATSGRYSRQNKVSFADYEAGNYPPEDAWKYSSFWYKDFDVMACKTMLRQLITKWAPMSVEMIAAVEADTAAESSGVDFLAANAVEAAEMPVAALEDGGGGYDYPPDEEYTDTPSDAPESTDPAPAPQKGTAPRQMGLDDL